MVKKPYKEYGRWWIEKTDGDTMTIISFKNRLRALIEYWQLKQR